eukprot:scaffold139480_cov22-Tisochrysis_lutea.AAC.3
MRVQKSPAKAAAGMARPAPLTERKSTVSRSTQTQPTEHRQSSFSTDKQFEQRHIPLKHRHSLLSADAAL